MRFALLLLVAAACAKPAAGPATDPVYEWICRGRTTDREVTLRVMAANRDDALAEAKKQNPDMVAPACTPNPRQ